MKIKKFEDIIAWQKGKELTILVYKVFKNCKDYSFKNQIERASVSIMNNIAEGFERRTNKELNNFLFIAKGSAGEVRSMLQLSLELNYISEKDFEEINNLTFEVSKILSGFIKSIKVNN
jgi:four helix bundle protein